MKCPYQTITIHKSAENYGEYITQDITHFRECCKKECPLYYTTEYKSTREITEHCHRAEREG